MANPSQPVIDAHAHCGIIDRSWPQSIEDYAWQAVDTDILGVAVFSPVMEIYDRYDPFFVDTPAWQQRREESNAHLLSLTTGSMAVYPLHVFKRTIAIRHKRIPCASC